MVTVNSDFWGPGYSLQNANSTFRKNLARDFLRRFNLKDRELLRTLTGAAAGSTATKTVKRVAHSLVELGGKRTVEDLTLVNRATTAADVTDLKANILAYTSQPTTYARDKAKIGSPEWN